MIYRVTVTNTWRVEVEARNESDAKKKVLAMPNDGYDDAYAYDGAEIVDTEEKD
jgi:hypothetical protein